MFRTPLIAMAVWVALTPVALAATPINETRPLDLRGKVDISNVKGSIQVTAWDRSEVQVTGSLGAGVERLLVEGDRDDLRIEVKYPRNAGDQTEDTTLVVKVPRQAALEIDAVSAKVDVTGVASRELEIDSVSGNVTVAAAPDSASIETVSGDQRLTLNSRGSISMDSVSGDIVLRGRLNGEVDAESVSGNVDIGNDGGSLRKIELNSVSGDMRVRSALGTAGQIQGETVSGDVTLSLPKNLSAHVNVESFSGDIRAPGADVKRNGFGPGSSVDTRYGNGSGRIQVKTFSGDMHLLVE